MAENEPTPTPETPPDESPQQEPAAQEMPGNTEAVPSFGPPRGEKAPTYDENTPNGLVSPRDYDHCPVCGCKGRFTVESMRGDFSNKQLEERPPCLAQFQSTYFTPAGQITLICMVDSCVRCGTVYTVHREKRLLAKKPDIVIPGKTLQRPGTFPPGRQRNFN
jgi:hypothetical protein